MLLARIDHVNLSIHDVDRARHFYETVLGLQPAPRPSDAGARAGAWFVLGAIELHLSEEREANNAASKRHVAFEVVDLEKTRAALVASGAPIEEARPVTGVVRFFARDPSGNRLEFFVRETPQRSQSALR